MYYRTPPPRGMLAIQTQPPSLCVCAIHGYKFELYIQHETAAMITTTTTTIASAEIATAATMWMWRVPNKTSTRNIHISRCMPDVL